jgi:surface antigen
MRMPLLCTVLALIPATVHSANLKFLENSLIAQLSAVEIAALKQEVGVVLNKSPDQEIINWASPNSGIRVQIKPKVSFNEGAAECRRTLFKLSKGGIKPEYYRFDICRGEDKKWQVKDSLIRRMANEDWKILEGTVKEVLDSDRGNKVPASWFNPGSKNSGVVVPISYFTKAGVPCREVAISIINSNGGTMDGHYTFCKKGDGWERE